MSNQHKAVIDLTREQRIERQRLIDAYVAAGEADDDVALAATRAAMDQFNDKHGLAPAP